MQLNQKHRLVVTLHYIEGFSVTEVAKMLKIPQGTVKSRLSTARAELKQALDENDNPHTPPKQSKEKEKCYNEKSRNYRQHISGRAKSF
jgi:transposase